MAQIVDPVIKKYFDLIKANTDVFKQYYYGDPVRIPVSSLPVIIGTRKNTRTVKTTSAEDMHVFQLTFTVVTDVRKDFSDDVTIVPGWQSLYNIVEGRDPDTMLLNADSLLNIIRHNDGIDTAHQMWTDMSTPTTVDYGLVANKRQPGTWSIEAAITTTCTLVQLR